MAKGGKSSYFAEERNRNNPNFFNNMKDEDLRKQVSRIIRDIKYGNLESTDFAYFQQQKIISACITESWSRWVRTETVRNALTYYLTVPLASGFVPYPETMNLADERINATNELGSYTNRANVWRICYQTFVDISRGADIPLALQNIIKFDKSLFYDL